jgi:cysteine synthase
MFDFDSTLSTDLAKVRFEIGDTNEDGHYLEDETINYFLANYSVGQAVVSCIDHIITQLSVPDFKLDWMSVSNAEARKAFENMLKLKQQKYGITSGAVMTSSIAHAHRADSFENEDGVYAVPDGR